MGAWLTLGLLATALATGDGPSTMSSQTARGRVIRVEESPRRLALTTDDAPPIALELAVSLHARISRAGAVATLSDLRKGDQVVVQYDINTRAITRVEATPEKPQTLDFGPCRTESLEELQGDAQSLSRTVAQFGSRAGC